MGPTAGLLAVVGVLAVLGGNGFLGVRFLHENADLETVSFQRTEGSTGNTGFAIPRPDNPRDVIAGIPRGVLYSAFGPFPWDAGPVEARALLLIELPLWYVAIMLAILGLLHLAWSALRCRWPVVLAFSAGLVAVL